MFKELLPVLADRPLTITVTTIPEGKIRVCVIPQSQQKDTKINANVGYREEKEVAKVPDSAIKALTTPLAITGTAEELDAELPGKLTSYAEAHVQLQHGIVQATEEITNAVKAIAERNKSKSKTTTAPPKGKEHEEEKETKSEPSTATSGTLPLSWCAPATPPADTSASELKVTAPAS